MGLSRWGLLRRAILRNIGHDASRTHLVRGFYNESLAAGARLARQSGMRPARLLDLDCDLASSTRQALEFMLASRLLRPGSYVYYDDATKGMWHAANASEQTLAHREVSAAYGLEWEALSCRWPKAWHWRAVLRLRGCARCESGGDDAGPDRQGVGRLHEEQKRPAHADSLAESGEGAHIAADRATSSSAIQGMGSRVTGCVTGSVTGSEGMGWPRLTGAALRKYWVQCGKLSGPPMLGCKSNCNRFTPCLVRLGGNPGPSNLAHLPAAELEEEGRIPILPDAAVLAAWQNGSAGFAATLARIAREGAGALEFSNRSRESARIAGGDVDRGLMRRLLRLHADGRLALRVTGPVSDGFWVRATTALAHSRWASAAGIAVSIVYRSAFDNYDDYDDARDGWSQYFEPVRREWPRTQLVGLSCAASSLVFRMRPSIGVGTSSGVYARHWDEAVEQRRWRREQAASLPLAPRGELFRAANAFWEAQGVRPLSRPKAISAQGSEDAAPLLKGRGSPPTRDPASRPVLGLHLRGTDRTCAIEPHQYLPLIRAYLCHRPGAAVFVATDDTRLLGKLRAALGSELSTTGAPPIVLAQADAIRGQTPGRGRPTLNPAVHARGKRGTAARPNASVAARLGREALLDTLLLSQTDFLVGSVSALTSYALLLSPHLEQHSFLWDLEDQPPPPWKDACVHDAPLAEPTSTVSRSTMAALRRTAAA